MKIKQQGDNMKVDYRELLKEFDRKFHKEHGDLVSIQDVINTPSLNPQIGYWWGNWQWDGKYITYNEGYHTYEIAMTRIDTAEKLGMWLTHLTEKNWITSKDLGDLVYAVDDLFHNIQETGKPV
jgi:hypothetical protein